MNGRADDVQALARHLTEPGVPVPSAGGRSLALAWALKDLCYQAWNSDPQRAVRAAAALHSLSSSGVPSEQAREIEGLAEWTAGIASVTRGQMNEAVRSFDLAAAALREVGLPDPAAQTQVPKIMALSMLGRHTQAAECGVAAQRELLAHGNVRAAARVSQNLAGLHLHGDEYRQAAQHYREAAVLFARLGEHEQSVLADLGLGDALASMGDFDEALRFYARARMRASNQGLQVPLALADGAVALVDLTRGRYSEALAGFESARRRYEALSLPLHLAMAEKQLADAYVELRLLPEAWTLLDTAVTEFRALESPREEGWALAQRGRAEALMGRSGADQSFAAAADLFSEQGNDAGVATVALARAELALARGDAALALSGAAVAAQGCLQAGQADGQVRAEVVRGHALLLRGEVAQAQAVFAATLASAQERQQLQGQVHCLTGQGLVALATADTAAARAAFEAAIGLFEMQRSALPADDLRSAFLSDNLRPYRELLRMAVEAGDADEVLLQLDRCRARSLAQMVDEEKRVDPDDTSTALRERLNWLYRRVQRLQDEGAASAILDEELLQTERELLERDRRSRLIAPARDARGDGVEFSVTALKNALRGGDALVEYGVLDDELFACVVTPGRVTLMRHMASWAQVLDAVQSARFQMETLRHGLGPVKLHMGALTERMRARLDRLHAQVWAPLGELLQACARVLIVPHAQLGLLPFAAMSDGHVLVGQRHEIAVAPSARAALRGLLCPPVPARRALAVGESSRLAHTAREAKFVAGLFEHGTSLVGEFATHANLLAQARDVDVLHLACHGQFRSDNPRFSALHLCDGPLSVDLAEALDLKPCTVVLSACETAMAELSTGDEMVGLVRAFMVAGASRVLASQWPVDDEVTAVFMSYFYGALVSGQAPGAALRSAQAATMAEHPHPYFWGAFTLYGGW